MSNDRIEHFNLSYFHALSKLSIATIAHLSFYNILPVSVATKEAAFVSDFELEQNYPNPFNASTTIEFILNKSCFVTLKIYNMFGQEVATLVAEQRLAGIHKFNWDAKDLASGVYLYRLEVRYSSTGVAEILAPSKKLEMLR